MTSEAPGKPLERAGTVERRKHRRYPMMETGTLWFRGVPFVCTVVDVSADGAQVEASLAPLEHPSVELEVPKVGHFAGDFDRVEGSRMGIKFRSELLAEPRKANATPETPEQPSGRGPGRSRKLGLAGGPGFEPGLLGPEPRVLPLNYPPGGRLAAGPCENRNRPRPCQPERQSLLSLPG